MAVPNSNPEKTMPNISQQRGRLEYLEAKIQRFRRATQSAWSRPADFENLNDAISQYEILKNDPINSLF